MQKKLMLLDGMRCLLPVVEAVPKACRMARRNAALVSALAAVVTCFLAVENMRESARDVAGAIETWKQTQRPCLLVERSGRLAEDGKNYNHEDLTIQNLGQAPKAFTCFDVKEYLIVHVSQYKEDSYLRTFTLPIRFYKYGVHKHGLLGELYKAVGDSARREVFDFDQKARLFFKEKGLGYYSETKVVVSVGFLDAFGETFNEYFDVEAVSGQRVISKDEFESYSNGASSLFKYSPQILDVGKVDIGKMWNYWFGPPAPTRITADEIRL